MSAKITGQIWDYRLETRDRLVLQALADRCEHDGTAARPSVARIVWMTDISESTVRRVLADLRARGVLIVTRKAGRHQPTEYRIVLNSLPRKLPFQTAGMGVTVTPQTSAKMGVSAGPLSGAFMGVKNEVRGVKNDLRGVAQVTPNSYLDSSLDSEEELRSGRGYDPSVIPDEVRARMETPEAQAYYRRTRGRR